VKQIARLLEKQVRRNGEIKNAISRSNFNYRSFDQICSMT